ncbi:hypothetical protein [Salinibacter phage M31CR41-2]|nr:hypothetical protein FGG68_gp37 [Salinibacter phage M31CR41-2]AUO79309.1 hypothetical protein [Salinibacter phage M31CR41-2]AUO79380.1 hypothetical protein [Salinibacter virus M31CR41-3]
MPKSRNRKRLEETVGELGRLRNEVETVADNAPEEVREAQSAIDTVEQRRREKIEEINKLHDVERTKYEKQKIDAQQAQRRAKRMKPFFRFLDGEIGLFGLIYRLTFR